MFLDDEGAAQRHHKEDAEVAADQREHEDAEVFEIETEEDQRRQSENNAGSNGLACVAGGLHDDGLKHRGLAFMAKQARRNHRNGNRSGYGKAGLKANIHGYATEDDAEDRSEQYSAYGKLRAVFIGGHKRLKFGHR